MLISEEALITDRVLTFLFWHNQDNNNRYYWGNHAKTPHCQPETTQQASKSQANFNLMQVRKLMSDLLRNLRKPVCTAHLFNDIQHYLQMRKLRRPHNSLLISWTSLFQWRRLLEGVLTLKTTLKGERSLEREHLLEGKSHENENHNGPLQTFFLLAT